MISVRGLRKEYGGRPVLAGLDLEVGPGERVALLGPNGAGKTTFFRCLLGICGYEGEVRVDGLAAGREARRRIGYVPQSPPRYDLTLRRFVRLFSDLREIGVEGPTRRLGELGLSMDEAGDKRLRELSGGMVQKALLAMALGADAPVLLLDEPTASLDPASRREFLRAVRDTGTGTTLLFASHRLDEIEPVADRILVLHRGGLVFDGPPASFWRDAADGELAWLDLGIGRPTLELAGVR